MRKSVPVYEKGNMDKRASRFCNLTTKLIKELNTKGIRKMSILKSDIEMEDFDNSKIPILDDISQKLDEVIGMLDKI